MRISRQTRDSALFLIGCAGMIAHGIVLPVAEYEFDFAYFAGFAAVAGVPLFTTEEKSGGGSDEDRPRD